MAVMGINKLQKQDINLLDVMIIFWQVDIKILQVVAEIFHNRTLLINVSSVRPFKGRDEWYAFLHSDGFDARKTQHIEDYAVEFIL